MVIYKITNKINGKVYIGQTTMSLQKRWNSHCNTKKKYAIGKAIQKYGKENFTIEEIDGANSMSELNYLECHYIYMNSSLSPNGYNLHSGGSNYLASCETKAKISKSRTGINLGFKHSEETKLKISMAHKGKTYNLGRISSQESKDKISKSHIGMKPTKETLEKMSKSHMGKTNPSCWKKIICINPMTKEENFFNSTVEASKILGIGKTSITNAITGRSKTAGGYIFKRVKE